MQCQLQLSCGIALATLLAVQPSRAETQVVVSAGDFDRRDTIVRFQLPEGTDPDALLISEDDQSAPLDVDAEGTACFILDELRKGASKTYRVSAGGTSGGIDVQREGSKLKFTASGKPVVQYQMAPSETPSPEIPEHFRHGAYLHPVASPGGLVVTDDYPPDHLWQRGIWMSWTRTDFEGRHPDFWNMGKEEGGRLTGEVRFAGLDETWSGAVHGGFLSRHQFIDHTGGTPKPVLDETWKVTVYRGAGAQPAYYVFDLVSSQKCASDTPLKLPKYHYGGLGIRGNYDWQQDGNFHVLTSEGETDRVKSNQQRVRWIHIGGETDGRLTGLAILCHPENFRAPQPVRVNPGNPQICVGPGELGDWEIAPGETYVSRYRFVVADGAPDAELLDRLWNDYAHPPRVTVETE